MSPQTDRSTRRFTRVSTIINIVLLPLYLLAIAALVAEYGFYMDPWWTETIRTFEVVVVGFFMSQQLVKFSLAPDRREFMRDRRMEYTASGALLVVIALTQLLAAVGVEASWLPTSSNLFALYIVLFQTVIVVEVVASAVRYSRRVTMWRIQPARLFIASFLLVIMIGGLLLSLPRATFGGIRFIDALFTSTSAVCVTGLVVVDTPTTFTLFGQIVIMVLIQIGGLGLMTFTTFFTLFSGRLSIKERVLMQEFLSKESIGQIRTTLIQIVGITLLIELAGAIILYVSWDGSLFAATGERVFASLFHAVSGFCNAGFSTFSTNLADPRVAFNSGVMLTISALIIFGGLGFMVISNLASLRPFSRRAFRVRRRLSVHSRIVLVTTLLLIAAGTASIYLFEVRHLLRDMSFGDQLLASFFHSVTCRTAGFNTIDIGLVTMPTLLIMLMLMFVGASPASTGGGIKTTTFTLLVISAVNLVRGKSRVEIGHRQITSTSIDRAYATLTLSLLLVLLTVLVLVVAEPFSLADVIFETVSAFATVGLSRGITPWLTDTSKITLMLTMLIGRVGAITMLMALTRPAVTATYDYPSENIII
jgi:trk system potassium uptake protein